MKNEEGTKVKQEKNKGEDRMRKRKIYERKIVKKKKK